MLWPLQYKSTQLFCNCILPWLPIHSPIVWLITFQQPHLQGTMRILRAVINVLSDISCRDWGSESIQETPHLHIWLLGNCHQQMVSISDSRFSFQIPTFLHLVASSPLSLTDSSRRRWNSESDGISGESEPHSVWDSHWWGGVLDLANLMLLHCCRLS